MDASIRLQQWNKWTDAAKDGRRHFTVDRRNLLKSLKCHKLLTPGCTTSWNAVFLSFCLCQLLQSVGGPFSDIHNSTHFYILPRAFQYKPQAASCALRLMFPHVESPFIEQSNISALKYISYRFIIRVKSCINDPLCNHFVDIPNFIPSFIEGIIL